jgi:serine/threonine protein kinase
MHACGVQHRDLKPENIMFFDTLKVCQSSCLDLHNVVLNRSVQDDVKIGDFGLSHKQGCYELTGSFGSLDYMAPERIEVGFSPHYHPLAG